MKKLLIPSLLCAFFLLSAGEQYHRKVPRTLVYSRAQWHYVPTLDYYGRWVDRPLLLDPRMHNSVFVVRAMAENAKKYGLAGLASLYHRHTGKLLKDLERAHVKDFTLLPEVYCTGGSMYDKPAAFDRTKKDMDHVFLPAVKSPVALKINGKTVISSYNADIRPPEFWKKLLDAYRKQLGDTFIFLPLIEFPAKKSWGSWRAEWVSPKADKARIRAAIQEHLRAYLRATDGIYIGCAPVKNNADRHSDITFFRFMLESAVQVLNEPEFSQKYFAVAARAGHKNATRVGYIRGSYGTWCLRETLKAALDARPDIIVIPEWDEQNENTSLRPTLYNLSTFCRVTRAMQGLSPELPEDDGKVPNLILSYRKKIALGEKPEFELLGLADSGGPCRARFVLKNAKGKDVFSSPWKNFSGKETAELRCTPDSLRWADTPYLLPRVEVERNGKTAVFDDGFLYIKLEPVQVYDYKYMKQPLRDLAGVKLTGLTRSGDRVRFHAECKENADWAELCEDHFDVFTFSGKSEEDRRAAECTFLLHFKDLGNFRHQMKGELATPGVYTARWEGNFTREEKDTTRRGPKCPFDRLVKLPTSEVRLTIPAAALDQAKLVIRIPGFFEETVSLKKVWEQRLYGVQGKSIPALSITRQETQRVRPAKLGQKSFDFDGSFRPDGGDTLTHIQIVTASGRVWHSAPWSSRGEKPSRQGKIRVWSEAAGKPAEVTLPENRIPVLDYRCDPAFGTALPCAAGRRYWGMAGGYPAQMSGFLGAGNRDSSIFIATRDFPAKAVTAAPQVTAEGWVFSGIGQHVALPQGVISRRSAYKLTMELCQKDPAGMQTLLVNRTSQPGAMHLYAKDGIVYLQLAYANVRYDDFNTKLRLPRGKWCRLELDQALDRVTLRLEGKTFTAPARGMGMFDTASAAGGSKDSWFQGMIRRITVDYRR